VNLLQSENFDVLETCAWAIGNIAGDDIERRNALVEMHVIPRLVNVVKVIVIKCYDKIMTLSLVRLEIYRS
jgi:hypothetical protein